MIGRPWKLDTLKNLPQEELRAWYDNMEAGGSLEDNSYTVDFLLPQGKIVFDHRMPKLVLPDGTEKN